jgi:WS/DGAT/MGAT family acyltransferase
VGADPGSSPGRPAFEPLGGLDAAFLALDTPTTPLHVAAVAVLEAPEGRRSLFSPSTRFAQIRQLVGERIHLVPRLRQRALSVPLGLHHPVWVDDPDFELDDHLSRASLPAPGGSRELDTLVAEIMSRPLPADRPLWELVVVEGLAAGRSAVVAKLHHAILDGVSGMAVMAAFFDLGPRARTVAPPEAPWDPGRLPSPVDLLRHAAASWVRQPAAAADALHRGAVVAADLAAQNRRLAAKGQAPPPSPFRAPRTSLNGTVSSRRRFASLSFPLEDLKAVRRAFGGTVNDVVLASVSGSLRRLLATRGEWPAHPLVAMVPVSTRAAGQDRMGNRVSGMLVGLASDVADPVARLRAVTAEARRAKAQHRLIGGRLVEDVAQAAAPVVSGRAMRWATGLRLFDRVAPVANVTVSNVPGPPVALWCAGSRVAAVVPVGPVADGAGLNVTALTYQGAVHLGLLACRRLVPEVQDLAIMVDDALAELVGAAAAAQSRAV